MPPSCATKPMRCGHPLKPPYATLFHQYPSFLTRSNKRAANATYCVWSMARPAPMDSCPWQWELPNRSEEHTSELQSLMRISYAVFCLKNKHNYQLTSTHNEHSIDQ